MLESAKGKSLFYIKNNLSGVVIFSFSGNFSFSRIFSPFDRIENLKFLDFFTYQKIISVG